MNRDAVIQQTRNMLTAMTSAGYEAGETLAERNFDSLDVVELELAVETAFGVRIPDELWSPATSVTQVVSDVARLVCGADPIVEDA